MIAAIYLFLGSVRAMVVPAGAGSGTRAVIGTVILAGGQEATVFTLFVDRIAGGRGPPTEGREGSPGARRH